MANGQFVDLKYTAGVTANFPLHPKVPAGLSRSFVAQAYRPREQLLTYGPGELFIGDVITVQMIGLQPVLHIGAAIPNEDLANRGEIDYIAAVRRGSVV